MPIRFAEVPIDAIDPLPNARTQPRSAEGRVGLAKSIKRGGVQAPVTLVPRGDRFGLLIGTGRFTGVKDAGGTTIPAVILAEEPGEADRLILQLTENLHREDLNPVDIARAIKRLMELSGCTAANAVGRLGYSGSSASRWLRLLELPDDVLAKVRCGTIAASAGYALAKVKDSAERSRLADETASGLLTRDALARKINRVKRQTRAVTPSSSTHRVRRFTARLGPAQCVTFAAPLLTLDVVINVLGELLARANTAHAAGLSLETFAQSLREARTEVREGVS